MAVRGGSATSKMAPPPAAASTSRAPGPPLRVRPSPTIPPTTSTARSTAAPKDPRTSSSPVGGGWPDGPGSLREPEPELERPSGGEHRHRRRRQGEHDQ